MPSMITEEQARRVIDLLQRAETDANGRLAYGEMARIEKATGVPRQAIINIRRGDSWRAIFEEMTQ